MEGAIAEEEILIRKYLLGDLAEDRRHELEERILGDDDFFDQVLIAEDEVIDQSLQGLLSAEDQRKFERVFLVTSERQEKLRFARALARYAETNVAAELSWLQQAWHQIFGRLQGVWDSAGRKPLNLLTYAVMLLLIGGGMWGVSRRSQQQLREVNAIQTDLQSRQQELERQLANERSHNFELSEQLRREQQVRQELEARLASTSSPQQTPTQPQRPASVFAVSLISGISRDGSEGGMKFTLPKEATFAELTLEVPNGEYLDYVAVLQDDKASPLKAFSKITTRKTQTSHALVLRVPASLLKPGDYRIIVSGRNRDGGLQRLPSYTFRVLSN